MTHPIDPADFAFEHFGRHVAPQHRDAWLSLPGRLLKNSATADKALLTNDAKKLKAAGKAGDRSRGMGGTSIFISASEVRVFGPDYRDAGFASQGGTADALSFARKKLFTQASEPWMMVMFDKSKVTPEMLHLNHPGDADLAYYSGKLRRLVRARPDALDYAADAMNGLSPSAARSALELCAQHLSGQLSEKEAIRYNKLRSTHPRLLTAARKLIAQGQDFGMAAKRLEMKEALHA